MSSGQGSGPALALVFALGCPASDPVAAASDAMPDAKPVRAVAIDNSDPPREQPSCQLVDPPPNMIDLSTAIPDAIIVAGYHRPDNFTGAPLPGYEAAGAWLEREAAQALSKVADALAREHLRLIIYDAYRPRSASAAMVAFARAHAHARLIEDGWVAPRSEHNRGRAIDLGLADQHGVPLDMGSAWDQFDRSSHVRAVEGAALERRLLLRAAMVKAGFVPYEREWWHFAYREPDGKQAPTLDRPYACR